MSSRPTSSHQRRSTLGLGIALLLASTLDLSAAGLGVMGVDPFLETLPAHETGKICYVVGTASTKDLTVYLTLDGARGEVGGKPGFADGATPICFTVPAVPGAGEWNDCTPPRDSYTETYVATARVDTIDHPGAAEREGFMSWPIERPVTKKDPRPDECKEEGDWSWSFKTGHLNCKKLPMRVNLPGFTEKVAIETDGLRLVVTGIKSADQLVMIREGDRKLRGKSAAYFFGKQNVSKLFDGQLQREADYELTMLDNQYLEGRLVVENAPYQGDVCSIVWPFEATALETGE